MHPNQLLIGNQQGLASLLPVAVGLLRQGHQVTLLAACASTKSIGRIDAWYELKNKYMGKLGLLFFTDQQKQSLELFTQRLTLETLQRLVPMVWQPAAVQQLYLAGDVQFVASLEAALKQLNITDETIVRIALAEAAVSARASILSTTEAKSVSVTVLLQGREYRFTMPMDGTTVLDAADDAGLVLPFSCRGGVCSTCRTKLTQGAVTLLGNESLDEWELDQGFVLACQAVPNSSTLELDYDQA